MKNKLFILLWFCISQINAQIITTVAGNGYAGYNGDGGQATDAQLSHPSGLTIDAMGNIYIADYFNSVIRVINTSGIITTIAGNGTSTYSGDGAQATAAGLTFPFGLILDAANNLYIADTYGMRVRKVVASTGIINTIAGNGTQGYSGDNSQATAAELYWPHNLALDGIGNLYISDAGNNRIRMVNTLGIITTFAGTGVAGYTGNNGQATAAELDTPSGLVFDATGNLYVIEEQNSIIRKINTSGIISLVAGIGTYGYSGDGGQATLAKLNDPWGLNIDAYGNIYIADTYNQRIRKINTLGIICTIAGNGYSTIVSGQPTGAYSGDGGQAVLAELNQPTGIAIDATGNLCFADYANMCIRKITNATAIDASICSYAGIQQFAINNEQISIYPNPSNGSFTIEPNSQARQTIQIYDVNSQLILTQTIKGKTTIDISSLSEGIYNINVTNNECEVNKRLIIHR